MKIFKKNFLKKDEIINEQRNKIFFCPYCKALCVYEENSQSPHNFQYNYLTKTYRCYSCLNDHFDHSTYAKVQRKYRSIPFHDNGKFSDDVVIPLIANEISSLRNKGFSNRDIHAITHFPRALINRVVATQWNEFSSIMPIDEFLKKHLEVPSDSSKKDIVEAALVYGCPYAVIRQLVPMRKIEITNIAVALGSDAESEEVEVKEKKDERKEMAINKAKRKIKILDDGLEKRIVIKTREKK